MHKIKRKIKRFTRSLQDETFEGRVTNFYAAKRTNLQRYNLEKYLSFMSFQEVDTLLVGEAPGYNGCRLTGVPFTSEYIVENGVCKGKVFGKDNGYKVCNIKAKKEQSASAMWSVLQDLKRLPLLWNAFPFHPYKEGDKNSNRKPKAKELEIGRVYLLELIGIFKIKHVIAVGNVADNILNKMGVEHIKIRHPSYGGRAEFEEQLRYNLQKYNEEEK